jgi:S1-C subfamily serine protease
MIRLTASFPGESAPIVVDFASVRVRADELDVAALHVDLPRPLPILELSTEDPRSLRGTAVLVVGYPTGVNALLAKADQLVVDAVTDGTPALGEIIDRLAGFHAISPIITSGVLGDVGGEKLVYDATTTSGGSGGPVFSRDGRVIGVNFAVMRGFTGSNFGVPIRFARELID